MGSRAVEDLATSEGVRRVTIADRNVTVALAIAARLAGQGVEVDVRPIDAHNHEQLVQSMRGYDVAASALGPFHVFEAKLVRAAIEAGVPYASICDEWEAAGAAIDQFGALAREQGLTVITGLGTSPGLSNVGIRYYASHNLSRRAQRHLRRNDCPLPWFRSHAQRTPDQLQSFVHAHQPKVTSLDQHTYPLRHNKTPPAVPHS
jgi:saccharopine dehydrogenase-like NADP-dependent oxidoreductase